MSARRATRPSPSCSFIPRDERLVHLAAGLLGHAEGAVAQAGGDVLGRAAEAGDLVVVDRRRPVHREVRDDAAAHQVDEHRREARLHDVAAEHDAPRRACACGGGDGVTTARKSRATSDVGEGARGRRRRSGRRPGDDANSSARTLFGRRAIGTVRILERSASCSLISRARRCPRPAERSSPTSGRDRAISGSAPSSSSARACACRRR